VLITGEVPTEADRVAVEQAVSRIDNVRSVVNDLAVMGSSTAGRRSNDAILGSKVKASFVDAKDLQANAFKVVAERGTIYLMGRVTEREANRAAEVARAVPGVGKVVRCSRSSAKAELADPAIAQAVTRRRRAGSLQALDQAAGVPALAAHRLHVGVELVDQRGDRQRAPLRRASSSTRPRSLRIQSTAKPKLNWSSTMVLPRLSICQLCAAPLPMTSSTCFMSSPAFWPKAMPSDSPAPGRRCRSG
jgi:hypothetical protein